MKNSEVLALKYRPKQFSDLIGQEAISTTLSLALDSNKIANAYLFSGLRGSGKTSSARIFAKGLVCENAPTSSPCDKCDNCKSANDATHLDIIELDAASNRGIDDIKGLIEHTKYKPSSAKYKIFIIDEVHMLTTQAFNALLKTLEEPPDFVKFILATTDPLKLPATILSRTQHFRFKKIAPNIILNHLIHILSLEKVKYDTNALEVIIRSGDGSLRDTLTLLDQAIIYSKGYITIDDVTKMLGLIEPNLIKDIFDTIKKSKNLNGIIEQLQDYEVSEILEQISLYLIDDFKTNNSFDVEVYEQFLKIIANSKQLLVLNSNSNFVLLLTLMQFREVLSNTLSKQNLSPQKPKTINQAIVNTAEPVYLFQEVIKQIKTLSFELGDCFEKSFKFHSFENNLLLIDSYAIGDCRTKLFKYFPKIREIIYKVFKKEIGIDFRKKIKKDNSPRTIKDKIKKISQIKTKDNNNETSSMIEEVEFGSGCVNSMGAIKAPTLAQKELNLENIKNSTFIKEAIKLFGKSEDCLIVRSKV